MRRSLALLSGLLWPLVALPWGADGHRAAAGITAARLCAPAASEIGQLLGEMTLAEASTWPDQVRGTPQWAHTREWHYLNVEDDERVSSKYEGQPGRGRLLTAIKENLDLLADDQAPEKLRREALSFVLHLVADLHQPLHVGRQADRGGNGVTVRFGGEETTLHRLWDGGLLRSAQLRPADYRRTLEPLVRLGAASWEAGTLEDWAAESHALRPWVYDFDARRNIPEISRRYAETGRQLTALRLAQAGVRTAWLLNGLWCD